MKPRPPILPRWLANRTEHDGEKVCALRGRGWSFAVDHATDRRHWRWRRADQWVICDDCGATFAITVAAEDGEE